MKLKGYQEAKIKELVDKTIEQLDIDGMRRKIVFQAPTGAGKTVMVTEAMCRLHETIADSDCQYNRVAFIWIAPNALHIQSYQSMKNSFTETQRLTPVIYDELDLGNDGYIKPGEVFFVNWQSINKKKNVMVRGSEQNSSIYDIIERTTEDHDIPVVCIIDEEHMFAGANAKKSEKVLHQINPKVEIRISATPKTLQPDAFIKIDRSQVINEGMIKMGISLNPALKGAKTDEALNMFLLQQAMKKRNQLAEAYKKLGININPLLLIQLPNDDSAAMSQDEVNLKDNIIQALDVLHDTRTTNIEKKKLAIWLSGEKTNLEGIEEQKSGVDVLIFKQAIAMGWDCPRAAVLLIYRKLSSESFTIQTVGRIMRMPQQRFYNDPMLNTGYVYTDLSADMIKIEADSIDYINIQHAFRRDGLQNVELKSWKEERSNKENNVLRSDFKRVMLDYMSKHLAVTHQMALNFWEEEDDKTKYENNILKNRQTASQFVNLNISKIQVEIPVDMNIIDEEGLITVDNKTGFARTPNELNQVFNRFCSKLLGGWSKVKCIPVLQTALLDAMEQLFEIFEFDAIRVICSKQNQPKFIDIVQRALIHYKTKVLEKKLKADRGYVPYYWYVPEARDYKDSTFHEVEEVRNHALMPYYELNNVSTPEQRFTAFLEENSDSIDWWYKNGDNGSDHFAVLYRNTEDKEALFYVDYIIRMKSGKVMLFDTKSKDSDRNAPNKHNALIAYVGDEENAEKNLQGGIIIEENQNWKFCPYPIDNTTDIINWDSFYPSQY